MENRIAVAISNNYLTFAKKCAINTRSMKKFLYVLMVSAVIFALSSVAISINSTSKPANAAKPKTPSISIESIGMKKQKLQYATIKKIDNLYSKMQQTPIVENGYTPDLCTVGKNSYIMGHSEPSYEGEKGAGLYAFSRLEEVEIGDFINVTNLDGQTCNYQATSWDFVRTDIQDKITKEQFNKLFFPKNGGKSTLTLQTCQKGSSTVRLILRAEMI
jgi:sortase (surface protein transpeptidase)